MKYNSIEEIKKANLADWEKKVMIEQFKWEQNVHEAAKYALKKTGAYKDLKGD